MSNNEVLQVLELIDLYLLIGQLSYERKNDEINKIIQNVNNVHLFSDAKALLISKLVENTQDNINTLDSYSTELNGLRDRLKDIAFDEAIYNFDEIIKKYSVKN